MTKTRKSAPNTAGTRMCCLRVFALLALFAGCVHVPVSSDIVVADKLEAASPLEPGDVLLVYGENATAPEPSVMGDYFTAGCRGAFHKNTVGGLVRMILKANPQPGRFAVRYANELPKDADLGAMPDVPDLRRDLTERLRYAVRLKESFEAVTHVPLYMSPVGVASCGNKTVLEARVWDLPAQKSIGSFTVTAEGEYTVAAWLLHVVVVPDTQQDAVDVGSHRALREVSIALLSAQLDADL